LKKNRANVKILLADNDTHMRQGLRNALAHEGYKDVQAVGKISILREIIAATLVDLLILDVETPDGDAMELVLDIRRNKLGKNPFLPIIFVTWDTDPATIGRAAMSGVDYILMKPIAPADLFTRIASIIADRKPFIATPGYIGPERREKERWGDTEHFHVPNTLRDKIDGKAVDPAAISAQVGSILSEMNSSRMEQAAKTIVRKVEEVCSSYEQGPAADGAKESFALIVALAKELGTLGSGDTTKLCASLFKIVEPMRRNPAAVDAAQMEILRPLSQSILLAASPKLQAPDVMEEISQAVSRFAPKKRAGAADGAAAAPAATAPREMAGPA
jgi:DNA-binding response OmpR family regulator